MRSIGDVSRGKGRLHVMVCCTARNKSERLDLGKRERRRSMATCLVFWHVWPASTGKLLRITIL